MKNIKALSNGKLALFYDRFTYDRLEDLREVIKEAFPGSSLIPEGGSEWYGRHNASGDWIGFNKSPRSLPVLPLSAFVYELMVSKAYIHNPYKDRQVIENIAIALLPSLIERATIVTRHGVSTNFEFNHEQIVAQAYKFAKEVIRQGH